MEITTTNTVMPAVQNLPAGVSDLGQAPVAMKASGVALPVASETAVAVQASKEPSAAEQKASAAKEAALRAAVDAGTQSLKQFSASLEFQIDPETKHTVVRVVDTTNNEVIKQIPSAQCLRISNAIEGLQKHILDEKA
jgi:flagellar protein FlaG